MNHRLAGVRPNLDAVTRLVCAAIAGALSSGCGSGGKVTASLDAGVGDAAAASCSGGPGPVVSATPSVADAGAYTTELWTMVFGVDTRCCEPQLQTAYVGGVGPQPPAVDGGSFGACDYYVEMPCSPDTRPSPDGAPACEAWCEKTLPPGDLGLDVGCCRITSDEGGAAIAECHPGCGSGCATGRPPRGFRARRAPSRTRLGATLASMAQLEAASVLAFDALHRDLARLGAPPHLLRAVRRARHDEVRHAALTSRAARRAGGRVPRVGIDALAPRSFEQLALDNAEEGCARETFGAALAVFQAGRARDPQLRAMMCGIARDELSHAALSWEIAAWLDARLDAHGKARVKRARSKALEAIRTELEGGVPADALLGTPRSTVQLRLLSAMQTTIEAGLEHGRDLHTHARGARRRGRRTDARYRPPAERRPRTGRRAGGAGRSRGAS